MGLQTSFLFEDINLELPNAYFRITEFVWRGGDVAEVRLGVWVNKEAAMQEKQPIRNILYEMPIPLENPQDIATKSYNGVRSLVYNWVKQNHLIEAIDA